MESASQQILKILEFEKSYVQVGSEELKNVNVERCVVEASLLFSDLKGAKLINDCGGLTVLADSMLRQLMYNLIDNTLKYGEKTSRIRIHYEEEQDQVKLIYEDDGVGVSDEEKNKLFQEGQGKGTGFGLYLIKRICEGYGWKIQETGKHGEGAQFTMTIPKTTKNGTTLYEIN
jgi:signal transduction histidine kinase